MLSDATNGAPDNILHGAIAVRFHLGNILLLFAYLLLLSELLGADLGR